MSSMIRYVEGDATTPHGSGPRVIVHCCNDVGRWGAGFVLALGDRHPRSRQAYVEWFRAGSHPCASGPPALGEVQFVDVGGGLHVANLIGQRSTGRSADGSPPVRYEAIGSGLRKVAKFASMSGSSVHMPRMGAGLAGGSWLSVAQIVTAELVLKGIPVTVYDLPSMRGVGPPST